MAGEVGDTGHSSLNHLVSIASETAFIGYLVKNIREQEFMSVFEYCPEQPPAAGLRAVRTAFFQGGKPRFPSCDRDTALDINEGIRLFLLGQGGRTRFTSPLHVRALCSSMVLHDYALNEQNDSFRSTLLAMLVQSAAGLGGLAAYHGFRFVLWLLFNDKDAKAILWYRLALVVLGGAAAKGLTEEALVAVREMKQDVTASYLQEVGLVDVFDGVETDPSHGDHWRCTWTSVFSGDDGLLSLLEDTWSELRS
jgi:hypothetical protein